MQTHVVERGVHHRRHGAGVGKTVVELDPVGSKGHQQRHEDANDVCKEDLGQDKDDVVLDQDLGR